MEKTKNIFWFVNNSEYHHRENSSASLFLVGIILWSNVSMKYKSKIILQKLFQSIVNVVQHTTIIIAPMWPLKQREGACTFAGLKHKMKKNPFSWHDVHSLGESQKRLTNVQWFKESNRITRPNPVFFYEGLSFFY